MADAKKSHAIDTTAGAAHRLSSLLAQPGWFTGTVQAYRGGALSEDLQGAITAPDMQLVTAEGEASDAFQRRVLAQEKVVKAWQREAFALNLSDAERDVARACVKKFAGEGKYQLDAPGVALLKALGLDTEG